MNSVWIAAVCLNTSANCDSSGLCETWWETSVFLKYLIGHVSASSIAQLFWDQGRAVGPGPCYSTLYVLSHWTFDETWLIRCLPSGIHARRVPLYCPYFPVLSFNAFPSNAGVTCQSTIIRWSDLSWIAYWRSRFSGVLLLLTNLPEFFQTGHLFLIPSHIFTFRSKNINVLARNDNWWLQTSRIIHGVARHDNSWPC